MPEQPDTSLGLEIAQQAALCGDQQAIAEMRPRWEEEARVSMDGEWWETAWYALGCQIFAQVGAERRVLTDPGVVDVVPPLGAEVATLIVEWWNETHAAPGAPLTDDATQGFGG